MFATPATCVIAALCQNVDRGQTTNRFNLPAEGKRIPKIAELGSNTRQELELEAF
jgi:hypothetical protein